MDMNKNAALNKMDELCDMMPTMHVEYRMKDELRCKKDGKIIKLLSCEGDFELPVLKLIAGAAVIMIAVCTATCAVKGVCKACRCNKEK